MSKKIRILLADDHAVVRQGFRMILGAQPDMEIVGEAGNGRDAVEMSQLLQPDVVVMDIVIVITVMVAVLFLAVIVMKLVKLYVQNVMEVKKCIVTNVMEQVNTKMVVHVLIVMVLVCQIVMSVAVVEK